MPSEPKRPIEELLEASAKSRRAEFTGEMKMPNPLRARLHDEIARRNREEEPRRSWLGAFWPRLVIIGASAAAVATAGILWLQNGSRSSTTTTPIAMNEFHGAAAPQQSFEQSTAARDASALKDATTAASETAAIPAAPPVVAMQAPAAAARSFLETKWTAAANAQRFSQTTAARQQRAAVLNNFDVQQEGDRIRLVDEDGSTYAGRLERAAKNESNAARMKAETAARPAAAANARDGNQPNEYNFRAEGFSNSLKKQVIFEGNYIAPRDAEQQKTPAAQARVIGTAQIAGQPPVQIDAVSTDR